MQAFFPNDSKVKVNTKKFKQHILPRGLCMLIIENLENTEK